MKTLFATITVALLLVNQSCKKNETNPAPTTSENTVVAESTPIDSNSNTAQDQLRDEAQSKPETSLALSEKTFDFGDIKKGQTVEHTYEVTNTGTNPLVISTVKPGCGCTAPDYTHDPIMPGKKGKIVLKFDSSNFDGAIHKQAEVYANVASAPIIIEFTGNVIPK